MGGFASSMRWTLSANLANLPFLRSRTCDIIEESIENDELDEVHIICCNRKIIKSREG